MNRVWTIITAITNQKNKKFQTSPIPFRLGTLSGVLVERCCCYERVTMTVYVHIIGVEQQLETSDSNEKRTDGARRR